MKDLKYADSHEWVKVEGNSATVGITDHAQDHLGDVVFVELPEVGASVSQGDSFGAVESVKASSDIYSPLSGKVVEVNEELNTSPGLVSIFLCFSGCQLLWELLGMWSAKFWVCVSQLIFCFFISFPRFNSWNSYIKTMEPGCLS